MHLRRPTLDEVCVFWHSLLSHSISKIALVKLKSFDKFDKFCFWNVSLWSTNLGAEANFLIGSIRLNSDSGNYVLSNGKILVFLKPDMMLHGFVPVFFISPKSLKCYRLWQTITLQTNNDFAVIYKVWCAR